MTSLNKNLIGILLIATAGFIIQSSLAAHDYLAAFNWGPLAISYILFGGMSAGFVLLLNYIKKTYDDMFGRVFLAGSTLKMLTGVSYLLIVINNFPQIPQSVAIHLLMPFMIFLFFEVAIALNLLKNS